MKGTEKSQKEKKTCRTLYNTFWTLHQLVALVSLLELLCCLPSKKKKHLSAPSDFCSHDRDSLGVIRRVFFFLMYTEFLVADLVLIETQEYCCVNEGALPPPSTT